MDDKLLSLVRESIEASDRREQSIDGYDDEELKGRRMTFCRDFYKGCRGEPMDEVLSEYTWSNLGWRLGVLFHVAAGDSIPEETQQTIALTLFDMLAHLHVGTIRKRERDTGL